MAAPLHGSFIDRKTNAQQLLDAFAKKYPDNKVKGIRFSSAQLKKLLFDDCDSVIMRFGVDAEGELTLVLAPYDCDGQRIGLLVDADENVSRAEHALKDGDGDRVLDQGSKVPPPFD